MEGTFTKKRSRAGTKSNFGGLGMELFLTILLPMPLAMLLFMALTMSSALPLASGHTIEKVKMLSLNGLLNWVCAIRCTIVIVFGYMVSYALTAPFAMPLAMKLAMP
jgi:hypothetical protein